MFIYMTNKTLINLIILGTVIFAINYLTNNSILNFFKKYFSNIKKHINNVIYPKNNNEEIKPDEPKIEYKFKYKEPEENINIRNEISQLSKNVELPEEMIIPKSVSEIDKMNIKKYLTDSLSNFDHIEILGNIKYCTYSNFTSEVKPFNIKTYYHGKDYEGVCILNISLVHQLTDNNEIFLNNGIIQFIGNYGKFSIQNISLVNFIKNYEQNKVIPKVEKEIIDEDLKIDSIDINTEKLNISENNLDIDSINSLIPDEILLSSEYERDSTEETTINNDRPMYL